MSLKGKVVLVTGSSRGVGKGIAIRFGSEGATVYVTGRSSSSGSTTQGLPGTVEDTADAVTKAGGVGIPVVCDHTDEKQVEALVEKIKTEQNGKLDILVNNLWMGYEYNTGTDFIDNFWDQELEKNWRVMYGSLKANISTTQKVVPIFIEQKSGIVINVTSWGEGKYMGNLFYDTSKAAQIRINYGMGLELRKHNIPVVGVIPGWVRTERIQSIIGDNQPGAETSGYIAESLIKLVHDPELMKKTAKIYYVGQLAQEYDFTDVDGTRFPVFSIPVIYPYDNEEEERLKYTFQ